MSHMWFNKPVLGGNRDMECEKILVKLVKKSKKK